MMAVRNAPDDRLPFQPRYDQVIQFPGGIVFHGKHHAHVALGLEQARDQQG